MKKIFLVRHGQTEMNVRNLKQGRWDSPLTEEGVQTAKTAGEYLKARGINFDHAYSSPAGRACDTLEEITDLPYKRVKGLQEISFGVYEGQPSWIGSPKKPYGDFYKQFNGEGEKDCGSRMRQTIEALMNQPGHETVLMTSHGASIVNFLRPFYELTFQNGVFPVSNCSIIEIDYDEKNGTFELIDIIDPLKQKEYLKNHQPVQKGLKIENTVLGQEKPIRN